MQANLSEQDNPPRPAAAAAAPAGALDPRQRAAADALMLALDDGHVFAALTGPPGAGKTAVLNAVLARAQGLRVLRIGDPGKFTDKLGAHVEQVALAGAGSSATGRHVVVVVDDAHAASVDLLDSLSRLAEVSRPGGQPPQVLLVGRPALWDRLKTDRFTPLEQRLAIRHELPSLPGGLAEASAKQTPMVKPPRTVAAPKARPPAKPDGEPHPEASPKSLPESLAESLAESRGEPPAAAPAEQPLSRIDDLVARRAELVPSDPPRRRWPYAVAMAAVVAAAGAGVMLVRPKPSPLPQPARSGTPNAPAASTPAPAAAPPAPASLTDAKPPPAAAPPPASPVPPAAPTAASSLQPPTPGPQPEAAAPPAPVPPAADAPRPAQAAALPPPAPDAAPPVSPAAAAAMLRRGQERFAAGDIAAARSLFEQAAAAGDGRAAYLAGRTYDRALLPPRAAGLADPGRAADWYNRAAALGDKDAAARLQRIGGASR